MSNLPRTINRKVRRLLFKPKNWRVLPEVGAYPVRSWWVESRGQAGHFQSGPFYSLDDAIDYCVRMNSGPHERSRRGPPTLDTA